MSEMAGSSTRSAGAETAEPSTREARRRLRGRNIALALGLIAWIVLIYAITIVKMKGG